MLDYAWPGFAAKDASAPKGWVGLDIDLIDAVSLKLGFTYEVHEMVQLQGERSVPVAAPNLHDLCVHPVAVASLAAGKICFSAQFRKPI